MDLKMFWAKTTPRQSIETHAIVSGHVAQVLFDFYFSEGVRLKLEHLLGFDKVLIRELLGYFVSLHDIGKIEFSFQSKSPSFVKEVPIKELEDCKEIFDRDVRHEKTSESCLKEIWRAKGEITELTRIMAKAIGAHHPGKTGKNGFNKDSFWFELQKQLESNMRHHFLKNVFPKLDEVKIEDKGVVGTIFLAVLIVSDWISSSPTFEDSDDWIDGAGAEIRIVSKAKFFLEKSGLGPHHASWPNCFSKLWMQIPIDCQRPIQSEINSIFNGDSQKIRLVLIEAPMGEGKTEAGIFAALQMSKQWKKDGFYMALPTAATSNQMIERVRMLFKQHDLDSRIRLLHSMSWLDNSEITYDFNDEIASWLAPIRRGLLGQYAVGTIDQVMLAATKVKYGVLRLLGLSNKVLIIDEIHSYDAYMSEIIKRLLEWCKSLEIPVVMLSATLTTEKKRELFSLYTDRITSKEYPLITTINEDGSINEKKVSKTTHHMTANISILPILEDCEKIADSAVSCVQNGGCLCILVNTVKEAQRIYCALKKRWDGDLMLFHAQFPAKRRKMLEEECVKRYGKDKTFRPSRSIIVATQVVEQSLDVDFDVMFSAVAPIDLLFQRLGRVHRHEHTERPIKLKEPLFEVMVPVDENSYGLSSFVYPECLLKSAVRILRGINKIRIPDDISRMVHDGYSADMVPPNELKNWLDTFDKEMIKADMSQSILTNSPFKQCSAFTEDSVYDDNNTKLSVKTRLGEPTIRISLLDDEDFEDLYLYLGKESNGVVAPIRERNIAEMVMNNSLTINYNLYKSGIYSVCDNIGNKLLSGVQIIHVHNGNRALSDGRIISNDPELGFVFN